jgi:protein-disulfide isomerase
MAFSVVVWEDLQCRDCAQFRMTLDLYLIPRYQGRVAFEHRDFPLPKHDWAFPAAVAARYLDTIQAGLGERLRRELLANIHRISAAGFEGFLSGFAHARGAGPDATVGSLTDPRWVGAVAADVQAGQALGIVKTPTEVIGDVRFIESFDVEDVIAAIDAALETAA